MIIAGMSIVVVALLGTIIFLRGKKLTHNRKRGSTVNQDSCKSDSLNCRFYDNCQSHVSNCHIYKSSPNQNIANYSSCQSC